MNWGNPNILYLLLIIPFLVIVVVIANRNKQKVFNRFADNKFYKFFFEGYPFFYSFLKNVILILAIIFVIIAAGRPQWDEEVEIIQKEGIDIVFLIDVSKSMEATDIRPSRIERAKSHISTFLDYLTGDRVALVPFAGEAFVFSPLTDDYSITKIFLELINTDIVTKLGTDIGEALRIARDVFVDRGKQNVIILITDGEDLAKEGMEVAKELASENIIVYTIGIGTPEGSPIMLPNRNGVMEYAKDSSGNVIITKLDAHTLNQIASITNGKFYPVTPQQSEIIDILQNIQYIERTKFDVREKIRYKDQFRYFLIVALILLMIDSLIILKQKKY